MGTDGERASDAQDAEPTADAAVAPAVDEVAAPIAQDAQEAAEPAFAEGFDESEWEEGVDAAYLQSKYTLVSVAAKRARQILAGSQRRVESLSEKPVTVALEELSAGKLYFERVGERGR